MKLSETSKTGATGATSEDETFDPSRFSRKSRESRPNTDSRFTAAVSGQWSSERSCLFLRWPSPVFHQETKDRTARPSRSHPALSSGIHIHLSGLPCPCHPLHKR